MYQYDKTKRVSSRFFLFIQLIFLSFTYIFIYTGFIATKLAIEQYNLSNISFLPVIFSIFSYPYMLYLSKVLYMKSGKFFLAIRWMVGSSFVLIVSLYMFLDSLLG